MQSLRAEAFEGGITDSQGRRRGGEEKGMGPSLDDCMSIRERGSVDKMEDPGLPKRDVIVSTLMRAILQAPLGSGSCQMWLGQVL